MEAFARALRQLPTTIADNAGLDSADIVSTLRAAHGADPTSTRMGVDVIAGEAGDMKELGIFESFKVKQQVGSGSLQLCGVLCVYGMVCLAQQVICKSWTQF
jgi:chaperonin GroEL (HSP60 family)